MRQMYLTFIASLILHFAANAQHPKHSFKIDTLGLHGDSTLVALNYFEDARLRRKDTAFLLADCMNLPRVVLFGRGYFKTKTYAPEVIAHGGTIEYRKDGRKMLTNYRYGVPIRSIYFNKDSIEISNQEFKSVEGPNFTFVVPTGNPHIVLEGNKKRCK